MSGEVRGPLGPFGGRSTVAGRRHAVPDTTLEATLAAVLDAHARTSSSAGWNGSPDPGNWRNIRPVCKPCNERLIDATHWTGAEVVAAHRAHLAAALAPVVRAASERAWDAGASEALRTPRHLGYTLANPYRDGGQS